MPSGSLIKLIYTQNPNTSRSAHCGGEKTNTVSSLRRKSVLVNNIELTGGSSKNGSYAHQFYEKPIIPKNSLVQKLNSFCRNISYFCSSLGARGAGKTQRTITYDEVRKQRGNENSTQTRCSQRQTQLLLIMAPIREQGTDLQRTCCVCVCVRGCI